MSSSESKLLGIKPYGNKVLVERVEHEKKGSLIISGNQSNDGRFVKGIVLAVGDPIPNIAGVLLDPNIHVNDVILYNLYNAIPVKIPGDTKSYDAVPYHEILVTFEGGVDMVRSEDLIPKKPGNGLFH